MSSLLALTEGAVAPAATELKTWAAALQAARLRDHVITLASGAPQPILSALDDGSWRVGPYIGALTLDGARLQLAPRIEWSELEAWVRAATGLEGSSPPTGVGTAPLIAMFWTRAVDGASRHGPPAFRREMPQVGATVRGRLDVRRTVRLRAKGDTAVASLYRTRELDNPVTRVIVAADRALVRQVGHGRWRTERVEAILPQLHVAVGRRARVPAQRELEGMRYTPITRPFKAAAELSSRVVLQDPIATTPQPGRVQGLVIDVDAVWTRAVLTWLLDARRDLRGEIDEDGHIAIQDDAGPRAHVSLGRDDQGERLVMRTNGRLAGVRVDELPTAASSAQEVVRSAATSI